MTVTVFSRWDDMEYEYAVRVGRHVNHSRSIVRPARDVPETMATVLERLGISESLPVLKIDNFHPYGPRPPANPCGAGSALLSAMLHDSKTHLPAVAYFCTASDKMRAFAQKNGFCPVSEDKKTTWYVAHMHTLHPRTDFMQSRNVLLHPEWRIIRKYD